MTVRRLRVRGRGEVRKEHNGNFAVAEPCASMSPEIWKALISGSFATVKCGMKVKMIEKDTKNNEGDLEKNAPAKPEDQTVSSKTMNKFAMETGLLSQLHGP